MTKALHSFLIFLNAIYVFAEVETGKREIVIGGLFHGDDELSQTAFTLQAADYNFVSMTFNVSRTESLSAKEIVCQMVAEGVDVIFGPSSVETSGIVSAIANTFQIPHVTYHWKSKPLHWKNSLEHGMTLNIYPDSDVLAEGFANVLKDFSWETYTIVYETTENLIRLKDILQIPDPQSSPQFTIHVRQLPADGNFTSILDETRERKEVHFVLDANLNNTLSFLMAADELNMLGDSYSYFIINLDTHTIGLSEIGIIPANITCLRLLDLNSKEPEMRLWQENDFENEVNATQIPLESGLIQDGLKVFFNAIEAFKVDHPEFPLTKHNCSDLRDEPKSLLGFKIAKIMRNQELDGKTGKIKFDNKGSRTLFSLEILELVQGNFSRIGYWDTVDRVVTHDRVTHDEEIDTPAEMNSLPNFNETFVIAVKFSKPFLMERKSENDLELEGNERFEGYIVDLINAIQDNLKFDYELQLVSDGQYGSLNESTMEWNGIMKQLLDGEVDFSVADLTSSDERKSAVDFTTPFMQFGIGILYMKPQKTETDFLNFLSPFSLEIWFYIVIAYICFSVLIFVLFRISEEDWLASDPRQKNPKELKSIWSLKNCFWLAMTIMGQGSRTLPKGSVTRMVTGLWWSFAIIMAASYTANLAVFLTADRLLPAFKDAEDLVHQGYMMYGAVEGGSTLKFLQSSNVPTYKKIWETIKRDEDFVIVGSTTEGILNVKQYDGSYAFIMESLALEYQTKRDCSLKQTGDIFEGSERGYGIAFPKDSPYREAFDQQILNLTENGVLQDLKNKWWNSDFRCDVDDDEEPSYNMMVKHISGAVRLLEFGCLFAFVIAIYEFLGNVKKISIEEKTPHWKVFKSELAFVLQFWINEKPVRRLCSTARKRKTSPAPSRSESPMFYEQTV